MTLIATLPLDSWLQELWDAGGSDLLLIGGSTPFIRVDGKLRSVSGESILSGLDIDVLVRTLISTDQTTTFDDILDVDFAFDWNKIARIRASAFTQQGQTALVLRMIPSHIPTFEELGLPNAFHDLADLPQGLVLVTGPTGSGKTTTLATLISYINETRAAHILTIEDPIEFVHKGNKSIVSQREIGFDCPSFDQALRSSLREDPDVLLIGEMRDRESIAAALTISETGHLVFSTLHTNDAAQTIDRIVDVFESWRRDQVREQFAASFSAIISQRLVAKVGGGRVAAFEILLATGSVRNLIRDGKSNQLYNAMTVFRTEGMRTMEMSLYDLLRREVITEESAFAHSLHPTQLRDLINNGAPISF